MTVGEIETAGSYRIAINDNNRYGNDFNYSTLQTLRAN